MKYILFDTETTGNQEHDRIIQVGALVFDSKKYVQDFEKHSENLFDMIKENDTLIFNELCSSDVKISYEAMEVHNITPEMIYDKPKFNETEFAKMLLKFNTSENYLIAHNIKFDLSMLEKEGFKNNYKLIDTYKCAKVIFPDLEAHRLQYLRYVLNLYKNEKNEAKNIGINIKAHDALGDVLVMKLLLDELLKTNSYDELYEITKKPVLTKNFTFGKYKGKTFAEVYSIDKNYLMWAKNNLTDDDMKYSIDVFLNTCQ